MNLVKKHDDQAPLHSCEEFEFPAAPHYQTQAGLQENPESGSWHETYYLLKQNDT